MPIGNNVTMRAHALREPALRSILVAALLVQGTAAHALWDDRLELFAGETVTWDSNIFRLSKDHDVSALLGTSSKSDTYLSTSAGFSLNIPVSRQRFEAYLALIDNRYREFKELDYTGHDGRATWSWQAGDRFSGKVGYIDVDSLASFADLRIRAPDPLHTRQGFVNGTFLMTPRWRIESELSELRQRHGDPSVSDNNVDISRADIGVSYITPASNFVGLVVRGEEGRYPNRQFVAGSEFDNAYRQTAFGADVNWRLDGKSQIVGRIEHLSRRYEQLPARNFQGTTFRATYDWQATGKVGLATLVQREVSPVEEVRTSFVLIEGIALRPRYDLSEKVRITGTLEYAKRNYLGDPGVVLGFEPERSDRVKSAAMLVTYRPLRKVSLTLNLLHERRTSNLPLTDYRVSQVQVGARIGF